MLLLDASKDLVLLSPSDAFPGHVHQHPAGCVDKSQQDGHQRPEHQGGHGDVAVLRVPIEQGRQDEAEQKAATANGENVGHLLEDHHQSLNKVVLDYK